MRSDPLSTTGGSIQASHAAGVRAVGVLTGVGTSAMLSADGPERLISSLAKLPAAVELA